MVEGEGKMKGFNDLIVTDYYCHYQNSIKLIFEEERKKYINHACTHEITFPMMMIIIIKISLYS